MRKISNNKNKANNEKKKQREFYTVIYPYGGLRTFLGLDKYMY